MSLVLYSEDVDYEIDDDWELHLGKLTMDTMERCAHKTFQIDCTDGSKESFKSVRARSIQVANALKNRGIGVRDIIILCGPNHNDICLPLVASLFIGSSIFSLAENQTIDEWCHYITLCKPAIIFCEQTETIVAAAAMKKMCLDVEIVVFGNNVLGGFTSFSEFLKSSDEEKFLVTEFDPETTNAIISCTSGSSGYSKAVCLTHKQLALVLKLPWLTSNIDLNTLSQESVICFSTLFWVSGSLTVLMSCIYGQTKIQTSLSCSPDQILEAIQLYKPTIGIFGVSILSGILMHRFVESVNMSCFKYILSIGSILPDNLREKLNQISPTTVFKNCYGMTECGGVLSAIPDNVIKPKSCGKVLPWIEWMIVDTHTEEKLGPNKSGELWVRGPTFFKEYHNDPESTKRAFAYDSWYKTGDLLYYDEDKYLYFVDREKDVFKYCSYQVCPSELEFVINKLDGVMKCCVMGKKANNDIGELPMAFVERVPGSNVTANDIKNIVKNTLSDWKQLRGGVVFLKSLPITYTGKIDKQFLKTMKDTATAE